MADMIPADLIMSLSACLENVFRVFFIEMEKELQARNILTRNRLEKYF